MDEPKQSAARASGFVIPIALALLFAGYLWTETGQQGSLTVSYSRLLGVRIEGRELPTRQLVGTVMAHSPAFVLAFAVFRRATARRCAFLFGAAGLLGFAELVQAAAIAIVGEFVGVSTALTAGGGLLLVIGGLGALERVRPLEIRATEGGRA